MKKLFILPIFYITTSLFPAAAPQMPSPFQPRPPLHRPEHVMPLVSEMENPHRKIDVRAIAQTKEEQEAFGLDAPSVRYFTLTTFKESKVFAHNLIGHSQLLSAASENPEEGNIIPLPQIFENTLSLSELEKILTIIDLAYNGKSYNTVALDQAINKFLSNKDFLCAAKLLNVTNILLLPAVFNKILCNRFATQIAADITNAALIQALAALQLPLQKEVIKQIFTYGQGFALIAGLPTPELETKIQFAPIITIPEDGNKLVNKIIVDNTRSYCIIAYQTKILLYNLITKKNEFINLPGTNILNIELCPNGRYLAATDNNFIYIIDMQNKEIIDKIGNRTPDNYHPGLTFLDNNKLMYVRYTAIALYSLCNVHFKEYDIAQNSITTFHTEKGDEYFFYKLLYNANKRYLATAQLDKISIYDAQNNYKAWRQGNHFDYDADIIFDKQDKLIATSTQNKLLVIDVYTKKISSIRMPGESVALDLTPMDNTVAVGFINGQIGFVNYKTAVISTPIQVNKNKKEQSPLLAVAMTSNGQTLLAAQDKTVYRADLGNYYKSIGAYIAQKLDLDQAILICKIILNKEKIKLSDEDKKLFATLPQQIQKALQQKLLMPGKIDTLKQSIGTFFSKK